MKKIIPFLVIIIISTAFLFFCLGKNLATVLKTNEITKKQNLVSTVGWKKYSTDYFSIKYPPNYIVNEKNYTNRLSNNPNYAGIENIITITEAPDEEILNPQAYTPKAWSGIEIFSPVEFECANSLTCETIDKTTINKLNFYPTEWKEMLLQMDGHSPTKSGTSQVTLNNKKAVHRWFINRTGLEGYPLSESNLYIKLNETQVLPIKGEVRRDAEKNLAIIETMYSTIVFHQ